MPNLTHSRQVQSSFNSAARPNFKLSAYIKSEHFNFFLNVFLNLSTLCSPINTFALRNFKSQQQFRSHFNCISTFSKCDYPSAEATDNRFKLSENRNFFSCPHFFPFILQICFAFTCSGSTQFYTIAALQAWSCSNTIVFSQYLTSYELEYKYDEKCRSSITCNLRKACQQ